MIQRRRVIGTATVVIAVLVALWAVTRPGSGPGNPPDATGGVDRPRIEELQTEEREEIGVRGADRIPIDLEVGRVLLEVVNEDGHLLDADVHAVSGMLEVPGRRAVPVGLGRVEVDADGYISTTAHVKDEDLRIQLERAYIVEGRIYDALSGGGVAGVRLDLPDTSATVAAEAQTDSQGRFILGPVPRGRYLLRGEKWGFMDLCMGLDKREPGIRVKIADADIRIDAPLYPVYAAVMTIENRTNVPDEVLSMFLVTVTKAARGRKPPTYMGGLKRSVRQKFKDAGHSFVFTYIRIMVDPNERRYLPVRIRLKGETLTSASLRLRPLRHLMDTMEVKSIPITRRWNTSPVRCDVPIPMHLAYEGVHLGGVRLEPGLQELSVPHGRYRIRPTPAGTLLDESAWRREMIVPEQTEIQVPTHEFGTITLQKGLLRSWRGGNCRVFGEGNGVTVMHYADFPHKLYVSPGEYRLHLRVPAPRGGRTVIWNDVVSVSNGQDVEVIVGG